MTKASETNFLIDSLQFWLSQAKLIMHKTTNIYAVKYFYLLHYKYFNMTKRKKHHKMLYTHFF